MQNIAMFTYYYYSNNKYKQTLSSFFLATDFHKVGCYATIMYLIKAFLLKILKTIYFNSFYFFPKGVNVFSIQNNNMLTRVMHFYCRYMYLHIPHESPQLVVKSK